MKCRQESTTLTDCPLALTLLLSLHARAEHRAEDVPTTAMGGLMHVVALLANVHSPQRSGHGDSSPHVSRERLPDASMDPRRSVLRNTSGGSDLVVTHRRRALRAGQLSTSDDVALRDDSFQTAPSTPLRPVAEETRGHDTGKDCCKIVHVDCQHYHPILFFAVYYWVWNAS